MSSGPAGGPWSCACPLGSQSAHRLLPPGRGFRLLLLRLRRPLRLGGAAAGAAALLRGRARPLFLCRLLPLLRLALLPFLLALLAGEWGRGVNGTETRTGLPLLASQESGDTLKSGGEGGEPGPAESCASAGPQCFSTPQTSEPQHRRPRGSPEISSQPPSPTPFPRETSNPVPYLSLLLPFPSSSSRSSSSDSLLDSPEPLSLLLLLSDSLSDSGSAKGSFRTPACVRALWAPSVRLGPEAATLPPSLSPGPRSHRTTCGDADEAAWIETCMCARTHLGPESLR